jgi:hypothetical protein
MFRYGLWVQDGKIQGRGERRYGLSNCTQCIIHIGIFLIFCVINN